MKEHLIWPGTPAYRREPTCNCEDLTFELLPESQTPDARTQLLDELFSVDPNTGYPSTQGMEKRLDLSPAVQSFLHQTLLKEMPETGVDIPVSAEDIPIFDTIKSRYSQIAGEQDAYVERMNSYINEYRAKIESSGDFTSGQISSK